MPLSEELSKHFHAIFKEETSQLISSLATDPPVSIRINKRKISAPKNYRNVSWCSNAYYLNKRPSFASDPLWHGGAYYVQEASSMFIEHVLSELKTKYSFKMALDLCAAPGGKTLLLADNLEEGALIVSNEVIKTRAQILKENVIKWGSENVIVTTNDPKDFSKSTIDFDLILVDAPCSGEGLFRKDPESINEWSLANVNLCEARQKRIIADIIPRLRKNGILLYSTCTYNLQENENNVQWMCNEFNLKTIPVSLEEFEGITRSDFEDIDAYHFYPHKTMGEGFFICAMVKESNSSVTNYYNHKVKKITVAKAAAAETTTLEKFILLKENESIYKINDITYILKNDRLSQFKQLFQELHVVYTPLETGQWKGKDFIPSHALAMSLRENGYPKVELTESQALLFLKKQNLQLHGTEDTVILNKGWHLATYKTINLGWLKIIDEKRSNNYYPDNWKLRTDYKEIETIIVANLI